MGVKGLRTFLEKFAPLACYPVNISLLASNYLTKTGRNAKIVVDAQSCYQMWCANIDSLVTYDEIHGFIIRLREFVESFKKINCELIFFFGGLNSEEKRRIWLTRYRRFIANVHRAIDLLTIVGRLPADFQLFSVNSSFTTEYILKYVLGCEVYMAIDNYREEIITYAHRNECLGIFGQNTDFVVSQVYSTVLSSKNFVLKDMTTFVYERVQLARTLKIRVNELPLLAILAGNDVIPSKDIQEFHRRICPTESRKIPFRKLIPAIARYIVKMRESRPFQRKLESLAVDLFSDPTRVELLRTSYNSYFVVKMSPTENLNTVYPVSSSANDWSRIVRTALDRYRNALLPFNAYSVLNDQVFETGVAFEDLRIIRSSNKFTRDQPSSTVLRPLRSRLYGILLSEKRDAYSSTPVTVREWCNENEESYVEPVIVKPAKPTVYHPGLMSLWNDDDGINELRWTLFLATISPFSKTIQWRSFDDGLLLSTLSVNFLNDMKYFNESELDAVLATIAICHPDFRKLPVFSKYHEFEGSDNKLDFRAVNICITLNRAFGLVLTILAVCGYPFKLSQNNVYLKFEVRIFQKIYAHVTNEQTPDIKFLLENEDCFKLFERIKKLISGPGGQRIK